MVLMATPLEEILPLLARLAHSDGESRTLADLATLDGRSPSHLQRIFKAAVGESPLQYNRRVRLQRAAAALLVTEQSVLEIALDAGFDTHEGFTRAFKSRFEVSPREFRKQRATFNELVRQHRTHLEVAIRTAPCVGLYRVPLEPKPTSGEDPMSYEITKKTIDEIPFLYKTFETRPEDIADGLGANFGAVFQYATASGIPFAGPPTARYPNMTPGLLTIDAGLPIAGPTEAEDAEINCGVLAGGTVASTIHKGPYDGLSTAHEAIQNWMKENNEKPSGAPWEVYLTDPGEVPDPAEWLTEIIWPLEG